MKTIIEKEESELISSDSLIWNELVKEELIKINNPLAQLDFELFKVNHRERILQHITKINSNHILQFLLILAKVEGNLVEKSTICTNHRLTIVLNATRKDLNSRDVEFNTYFLKYYSTRLPHCCGVTEYGEFIFSEYKIIDKVLLYNLLIDLIRLTASTCRKEHSGAMGMINYYDDTEFMNVLKKRDDLTFIKKFTNPKTSATLRSFIFDTKI